MLGRRQALRWTLKEINLTVPQGQLLMLAGANGAGKTTLLRVLSGAWSPSQGHVLLFEGKGEPRSRLSLLTHADHLYDELTAMENMQLLTRLSPRSGEIGAILEEVGLKKRLHEPVRVFSAGMRKRLAFARLLYRAPELVLIDEPYSQLDPQGALLVDRLFGRLRNLGCTVLVATHQLQRVAPLVDRALLLSGGRLIVDDLPEAICSRFTGEDDQ
jgi:heme exporter protein A